jgi:ketosteroid isomerase-like protein
VTQHVSVNAAGDDTFLWTYIYRADVGGRLLTTLLGVCQADVVIMSDDEHDIRALEQQLARAWATRDRPTVERILAREYEVTTPDGTIVSGAALLGATFDATARIVESMTTDDDGVTVRLFNTVAVVRGRTRATVAVAGTRQTDTVQFTDVVIKRAEGWQVVASHQSRVAQ